MSRENLLAVLCALVRFAVCCYRAAHQAVIIDEATTYNQFVSGPWRKLFGRYDANNHLLSSLLIKVSVTLGHVSPFLLRLPSLLSGLALTLAVWALLERVETRFVRWTAFALFCLHPLLLDFSILARGYSLSLALFTWALYLAWNGRPVVAGALLGLAIASNLAILFPVLAFLAMTFLFDRKSVLSLAIPALILAGALNYASLRRAHSSDFYTGYPLLHTAATSFVYTSLHAGRDGILGERETSDRIAIFGLPLLLLAGWKSRDRRPFFILAITFVGLVLARHLFGVNYPADRTCLYFAILGILSWAMAADAWPRAIQIVWLIPALLVGVQFCTQLQMRYFEFWQGQADDEDIARLIQKDSAGKPERSLVVSTTWIHQSSLEFYRRAWNISALKPVERLEPTPLSSFDFYVLSGADYPRVKEASLRPIYTNPNIEVVLAEP